MYRYRNTQGVRIQIPDAFSVEVDPGEEFDSELLLNNPTLVPADAATQAAQDARDAADGRGAPAGAAPVGAAPTASPDVSAAKPRAARTSADPQAPGGSN